MDLRGFVASCEYQIFVLQGFASSRNLRRKTRFEEVVVRIFVLLPAMQTRSIMPRAEAQGRRVGKAVVVLWSLCASASLREEILVAAGGRGGLSRLARSRDSKTVCVAHPTGCRPWSPAPRSPASVLGLLSSVAENSCRSVAFLCNRQASESVYIQKRRRRALGTAKPQAVVLPAGRVKTRYENPRPKSVSTRLTAALFCDICHNTRGRSSWMRSSQFSVVGCQLEISIHPHC
jgi:hypothetical protein